MSFVLRTVYFTLLGIGFMPSSSSSTIITSLPQQKGDDDDEKAFDDDDDDYATKKKRRVSRKTTRTFECNPRTTKRRERERAFALFTFCFWIFFTHY